MARKVKEVVEVESMVAPPPSAAPAHAWDRKMAEGLDFDGLWSLHAKACSRDSPECPKTFTHDGFRRHVLTLVSEKQIPIA
jgi:hypothetical protein